MEMSWQEVQQRWSIPELVSLVGQTCLLKPSPLPRSPFPKPSVVNPDTMRHCSEEIFIKTEASKLPYNEAAIPMDLRLRTCDSTLCTVDEGF